MKNYLKLTVAPASSSFAFRASASSDLQFSLTTTGAFSTKSLASLSQSHSVSFTTLITPIFCAHAEVSSTLTVSEPVDASHHPAHGAATTAAAAVTPNSSSNAFTN